MSEGKEELKARQQSKAYRTAFPLQGQNLKWSFYLQHQISYLTVSIYLKERKWESRGHKFYANLSVGEKTNIISCHSFLVIFNVIVT